MTEATIPLTAEMNARGRAIATSYYESGFVSGYVRGRADEAEALARLQRTAAAVAGVVAKAGPYAGLADKRGEHERADRQRSILRERGISA